MTRRAAQSRAESASEQPGIVFWPEAALPFFLEREALYQRVIGQILRESDSELVVGAPRAESAAGPPYRNSVYLVSSEGQIDARYDKQLLLPFMEYFPLGVDLVRREFGRMREFTPGSPSEPLPTRAGPAGLLVCNEAMLPHVAGERMAEGATYLVNPSNDSWAADAGFAQHLFDMSSFRAVEQRTSLVRASDSGPSGVVDPWGRVLAQTEPLTQDTATAWLTPGTPHATNRRSLYGRFGDLFGVLCGAVTAATLLRRRPQSTTPAPEPAATR